MTLSMCLLLFAVASAASGVSSHTLAIAYNTTGEVSTFPYGAFALTFDGYKVVSAGYPKTEGFSFQNASQPPWDWMRTPLNRTFDLATSTYNASYRWGSLLVQHLRTSPLALDMEVTVTNTMDGVGIMGGTFGVHGDEVRAFGVLPF